MVNKLFALKWNITRHKSRFAFQLNESSLVPLEYRTHSSSYFNEIVIASSSLSSVLECFYAKGNFRLQGRGTGNQSRT